MKKHKYLFVACLSLFPIMVVAENDTRNEIAEVWAAANINKNRLYKGKVVDEKTSEPLVGATVKVKGSTIGTITDIDGNFKLDVPANISPIVFEVSYMGYASKEATPHKTEGFTIRLAEDSQVLEEVQIIAYGKQSKMSVTAAISSISNKDLLRSPAEVWRMLFRELLQDFRPYRCPVSRERKTRIYMCGVRGLYLMNFPNRLFWWTEWNVLFSRWICTKSKASRF